MRRALLLFALGAGCRETALDELPPPETCKIVYEVTATGDVDVTYELGRAVGGGFMPIAGARVELSTLTVGVGQWGFSTDIRITTQDPVTFPEQVCGEIMQAPNSQGGALEQRGNMFRRQPDGSLLAKDVQLVAPYKPGPGVSFAGVIDERGAATASVRITYPGYGFAGTTTAMVTFVNEVGYLGTNAGPPVQPDGGIPAASFSSCTSTSVTPPQCTDFELQPLSGAPPANVLAPHLPVFCDAAGAPLVPASTCEGGIGGIPVQAQCTIRSTESWGILTIRQMFYGLLNDPAAAQADCTSRGGMWSQA